MNQTTSWNPQAYATNARLVSDLGGPLLQLLEPQPGELILDLGCGDGALTEKIADYGCKVIGVDSSLAQLRTSKQRKLQAAVMDGHTLCFRQQFDAVFTNAATIRSALHAALLRRGVEPAPVDPWYYPAPQEYSLLLSKVGFAVNYIELIPRPTQLPGDILAWLEIFAQPFTKAVSEREQSGFLEEVRNELAPRLCDGSGNWFADYVRLRFKA